MKKITYSDNLLNINLYDDEHLLVIKISDKGQGIKEHDMNKIWNYLIENNKYQEAKEITDNLDYLNSSLLISQGKKWIENKDFNFDLIDEREKHLLMTFSEIKKFPMRLKCATMSWSTFQDAVNYDK